MVFGSIQRWRQGQWHIGIVGGISIGIFAMVLCTSVRDSVGGCCPHGFCCQSLKCSDCCPILLGHQGGSTKEKNNHGAVMIQLFGSALLLSVLRRGFINCCRGAQGWQWWHG